MSATPTAPAEVIYVNDNGPTQIVSRSTLRHVDLTKAGPGDPRPQPSRGGPVQHYAGGQAEARPQKDGSATVRLVPFIGDIFNACGRARHDSHGCALCHKACREQRGHWSPNDGQHTGLDASERFTDAIFHALTSAPSTVSLKAGLYPSFPIRTPHGDYRRRTLGCSTPSPLRAEAAVLERAVTATPDHTASPACTTA